MFVHTKLSASDFMFLTPQKLLFVVEYTKDFDHRRAAEASGYDIDHGAKLRKEEDVNQAIQMILTNRLEASDLDAAWLLGELRDNHFLARQKGNLTASNAALNMIAKHSDVDAYAAQKVKINTTDEVIERLKRGRKRTAPVDEVSFL